MIAIFYFIELFLGRYDLILKIRLFHHAWSDNPISRYNKKSPNKSFFIITFLSVLITVKLEGKLNPANGISFNSDGLFYFPGLSTYIAKNTTIL